MRHVLQTPDRMVPNRQWSRMWHLQSSRAQGARKVLNMQESRDLGFIREVVGLQVPRVLGPHRQVGRDEKAGTWIVKDIQILLRVLQTHPQTNESRHDIKML